jgi:hypothetical protein
MDGLVPAGLQVPAGMDPLVFYLQLPAMSPTQAPKGADLAMTTTGPDQVWFLVVAITCIVVPALFLALRVYTRLAIVGSFQMADCEYTGDLKYVTMADNLRFSVPIICTSCESNCTGEALLTLHQPLIVVEVVMGHYMVHWGAGVHQWQVTLDQLFHQLFVCSPHDSLCKSRLTFSVGEYRTSHILSTQLPSQDGNSPPIPQAIRTKP